MKQFRGVFPIVNTTFRDDGAIDVESQLRLVRSAAFGWAGWADVASALFLVGFALLTWRVAIHAMTRKLID